MILEIADKMGILGCRLKNFRYLRLMKQIIKADMSEQNYLEHVKIPIEIRENYYNGNRYMDYFYSENEKKQFYERWESHIKE